MSALCTRGRGSTGSSWEEEGMGAVTWMSGSSALVMMSWMWSTSFMNSGERLSRGRGRGTSTTVRTVPGMPERMATRSAMSRASRMDWLTMTMEEGLRSASAQMSSSSARRASAVRASTWLKGSSMTRISGSTARARATPTRCLVPRLSSRG